MAENILHYGGVRMRINGSGNLQMRMRGLDDVDIQTLVPLAMSSAPGREPTRLSNFKGQRMRFEGKTTLINETFKVNRIIIFVKALYSQYPG